MKNTLLISAAIIFITSCSNTSDVSNSTENDWCISGGTIYTAQDNRPTVEAVAVKNGQISYAGDEIGDWCNENEMNNVRIVNLKGSAMYPGLTDAHGHLLGIGLREITLNLESVKSVEELKKEVKKVVEKTPVGETVYGRGWIETHWPEKRFPNRLDLDEISTDHPIILERADGHAVVTNSLALSLSGIDELTTAPFGGAINKFNNQYGKKNKDTPNGMLIDNASILINDLLPKLTVKRKEEAYIIGAELYASRGWTGIHSMSVDPADISIINRLADENKIKIRVYNSVDINNTSEFPKVLNNNELNSNELIQTRAIKLYADGALGSRGASLIEPYSDDPTNSGLMTLKEGEAKLILEKALKEGVQINIHAIGDFGNREVLRWYKNAFDQIPIANRKIKDPRWRIEHSQILHIDDISLFSEYGIIPSMQPSHAIGDLYFAENRLGKKRLAGGYAWRSLIDTGSIIAGGTDAPVETGDPRIEFYAAIVRKGLDGFTSDAWYNNQKVNSQEALKMFTKWPAYASFREQEIGTIQVGKKADFTIFDIDILTSEASNILNAKPLMTIVDGKVAFETK